MKKTILVVLALLASLTMHAHGRYFEPEELTAVGAYYYPEHWDESQWERDIKKMAGMGFEFIHLGEFAWAFLEPEKGKYDFEWLDKAIAISEKNGLKIVLCTSTATPPAWLSEWRPEILRVMENGQRMAHGRRQHASFSSDFYRKYSLKMIEKLAERYGTNPNVIGWQLDNEPKGTEDFSENATERFRDWLRDKYKDIDTLNSAWGTPFWSMVYNNFDQITLPRRSLGMSNPHQWVDHRRFMAQETADFLHEQAETIRRYALKSQWITTNFQRDIKTADPWMSKDLDFISFTTYLVQGYSMGIGKDGFRRGNFFDLPFASDYYRSIAGTTGIMELQPGQINWSKVANPLPEPGAVRMWLWHAYALGNDFVCTYRFRQPLYGSEQYHYGILGPDGVTPTYSGKDFGQFAAEIRKLRKEYDSNRKPDVAYTRRLTGMMFSRNNRWDMERQPQAVEWDYKRHVLENYYIPVKSFGAPVEFVDEIRDFTKFPVLIAPAYQLLDRGLVEKWKTYVEQGGQLVLSCRTGQKDRNGHLWEAKWAAPIYDLIGAELFGYDTIPAPESGVVHYDNEEYEWNNWGDILEPREGTESWAEYRNGFYSGKSAVTHRKLGKGTVTYIGVDTDTAELEKAVLRRIYEQAGIATEDLPAGMAVEYRDGFGIAVNYSDQEYPVPAPEGARFIFGGATIGSCEVAVWK